MRLARDLTNSLISERAFPGIFVFAQADKNGSTEFEATIRGFVSPLSELYLRYESRLDPVHSAGIYVAVKRVVVGLAILEQ